tara:strand:+ start:804 stop:1631 length:828 start_codon:yes stop_codon:yes gene_type:complete
MNIFVSLHGVAHNLQKVTTKEYFTVVPKGMKVYMFAPTNHCIYSNVNSEQMMKRFLKNPQWSSSPECEEGGLFEHTQLYLPGNTITNLLLDGDDPDHYGVYDISDKNKKIPLVFDATKTETTYDVERFLRTLQTTMKGNTLNVFLCICSPHSISPPSGSIMKWKGRSNPPRKSTQKYDSFHMSDDMLIKAKHIQEKRLALDKEGKKRFKRNMVHRRFTRSMSFPVHLRNGSTDHIPPRIGKGLGDMKTKDKERGLYFKIDDQDRKIDLVFQRQIQ